MTPSVEHQYDGGNRHYCSESGGIEFMIAARGWSERWGQMFGTMMMMMMMRYAAY